MDRRSRAVMPLTLIVVLALLMPATVLAKGPAGRRPSTRECATNNLSVPTIMIGGSFTGVTCDARRRRRSSRPRVSR